MINRKCLIMSKILMALCFVSIAPSAFADDYSTLQRQINKCYSGTGTCAISFGGAFKLIREPLLVIPTLVTLRDLHLTCAMASGPCIKVTMDGYESTYNSISAHTIENFTLVGNGSNDGIQMSYNGNNPSIDSVIALDHVRVTGFSHGIVLGSGNWANSMHDMQVGSNHIGLWIMPNTTNAGERNTFQGTVYNNDIGLEEDSGAEFEFEGTSFDYNTTQMILNGGTSFDGHIEGAPNANPSIYLNALPGVPAGALYMSAGSSLTVTGYTPGSPPGACYVQSVYSWNYLAVPPNTWGFVGSSGSPVCGPATVYLPVVKVDPKTIGK